LRNRAVLLMVGIQESARANALIVVVKLAVVIVFIGVGWSFIHRANYTPYLPVNTGKFGQFGLSGVMMGAGTIFFAYIGFDAVSTAAQEARNPQKDMPIGIIGSLAVSTVLYVCSRTCSPAWFPTLSSGSRRRLRLRSTRPPYRWMTNLVKFGIIMGFTSV
jgi:APA family basic amino acid/polyamine antiporter